MKSFLLFLLGVFVVSLRGANRPARALPLLVACILVAVAVSSLRLVD